MSGSAGRVTLDNFDSGDDRDLTGSEVAVEQGRKNGKRACFAAAETALAGGKGLPREGPAFVRATTKTTNSRLSS